ncbi:hypothetical protein O0L34_g6427 [Tuta absoluta]|nr:hypothetical protein O0L34_g6427 [Tuta absoluta]
MNERCATLKAKLAEAQNEQVDNLEEKLAETEVTTTMFKTNAKTNKTVHEYDDINYMPKIYKQKDTEKNSLDKSQKECQHKSEIELTKSCVQRNLGSYPSSKKYENVKLVRMKEPKNKTKNEVKSSNKWSILRKSGNVKTVKPNKKVTHGAKITKNKVDAEVGVHPVVHNNYCQYVPIQDETTQVHVLKDQAQSMSQHSECMVKDFLKTLARRFFSYPVDCEDNEPKSVRNVAIYSRKSTKRKLRKEASTIHFNALKAEVEKETMTIQNPTRNVAAQWDSFRSVIYTDNNIAQELLQDFNLGDVPIFDTLQNVKFDNTNHEEKQDSKKTAKADMPPKYLKQVNQKAAVDEILPESRPPDTSSLGVFQSLSSLLRDESRIILESSSYDAGTEDDDMTTDTTVYTLTNWGYEPPRQKKLAKYRWTLVTKSNMATATETPKCCDASTVTSDWWSPVLERKNKGFTLAKNEVQVHQPTPKTWQDRCVGTSARVVTFNSVAKIVPSMRTHLNLMSPSRYLLESQKYYNELFTTKSPFRSDYENNERYSAESRFSSHRSHVLKRKGFKKKRSEDSYTKLYSPFIEKVWSAKAVHRNPSTTVNPRKQRSPAKKNKEGLQAKGVTKTRHTPRFGFRKPELKIKAREVNLVTRPYLSTENISLDNNYHSLTEISSL